MSLFSLSRLRTALAAAAVLAAAAAVAPTAAARQDADAYPDLFKPVAAEPPPAKAAGEVKLRTERGPRPSGRSAGVVRAGFESPAGAKAGVVRTSGTAPAAGPLGAPADDLDFFLAPNPVPAAPAETTAGATGTAMTAKSEPIAEPSVRRAPAPPAPGRTTFSAADFGFAPAAPAPTPAEMPADDGLDDPFAGPTGDPFAGPVEEPAGRVTTADAIVDPAVKTPVTPAADPAPVDPFAAGPRNPLAPANPLADPFAEPAPAVPTDNPKATPPARTAEASAKPIPKPSAAKIPATVPPAAIAETSAGAAIRAATEAPTAPQTAAVSVRWERTGPVRVGRLCTATLVVANAGPADARGVEVSGVISDYLGLTAADPAPLVGTTVAAGGVLRPVWAVGDLPAGEQRKIVLTHRPTAAGDAAGPGAPVLAATVRTALAARDAVIVTEPKLTVELDGTREALIGEPAAQTIRVTNPGTGSIDQVLVEATLPAGLEHRGGKTLTMNVGALAAGQTKPIRLSLTTTAGGVQTVRVRARGEGGLEAVAEASVKVKSPRVELALSGPSLRYVNRTATLTLTVTNPGDAATDNVRMGYRVPDGFAFLDADNSGSYDPSGRIVTWFLGRVEAGQSLVAAVTLKATGAGEQTHRAEVSASGRAKSSAEHVTRIAGTASLSLTIEDGDDPVEVGAETTYTVTVRNEGTAAAKTVGLACRLPDGTDAGAVRGPASYRSEGRLVLFDSLPELAPGQSAVYTLRIKGTTPGSKRFQTRLVSESISEPLIHEEITKFYAE